MSNRRARNWNYVKFLLNNVALNKEAGRKKGLYSSYPLLNRKEISRIERILQNKKATLVPVKIYLKNGRVKVLIGIGIGKSKHDKRDTIKDREGRIEISRVLKRRLRLLIDFPKF